MNLQDIWLLILTAVTLLYGGRNVWYMGTHKNIDTKMRTQSVVSFMLLLFTFGILTTCIIRWVTK